MNEVHVSTATTTVVMTPAFGLSLGTYLGWNFTPSGERPFHAGQICNYAGGVTLFAHSAQVRQTHQDSRPSLQKRYGSHESHV